MKVTIMGLLAIVSLSGAQGTRTFTGTISDDMCASGSHAQMRMGPTDAECTTACVDAHGAAYVLTDGKRIYILNGRQLEKFAGQKVTVVGTLDAKSATIHVDSIAAAR
jgi:Protein of unknown function (DUF5818)